MECVRAVATYTNGYCGSPPRVNDGWHTELRWIWSISEYNLKTRDSPKWTLKSGPCVRERRGDSKGIPRRSMKNVKWYSSSQVSTAKYVSYPQLTTIDTQLNFIWLWVDINRNCNTFSCLAITVPENVLPKVGRWMNEIASLTKSPKMDKLP